eukprot:2118977-Rhodomonas_salina.1
MASAGRGPGGKAHCQPSSTEHSELQPSPSSLFPSSHPCTPATYPSPQISSQMKRLSSSPASPM